MRYYPIHGYEYYEGWVDAMSYVLKILDDNERSGLKWSLKDLCEMQRIGAINVLEDEE